jgi:hypothetical protein
VGFCSNRITDTTQTGRKGHAGSLYVPVSVCSVIAIGRLDLAELINGLSRAAGAPVHVPAGDA